MHKYQLRIDTDLNIKLETVKLLEENPGGKLHDMDLAMTLWTSYQNRETGVSWGSRTSSFFFFLTFYFYFILLYNTVLVCHTLTWIHHRCTCDPKHEPPSHLPPHSISLGHPHAPAPSILHPASDIDWRFNSYMIVYMLECHSPKSSHPLPLSPKVRYTHLCLFCCLAYRVRQLLFFGPTLQTLLVLFSLIAFFCTVLTFL